MIATAPHRFFNQAKKIKATNRVNYFLVFLLLFVSGNPAFYKQDFANALEVLVAFGLLISLRKYIDFKFVKQYGRYVGVFLGIFAIQLFNLGSVPYSYVLGFIIRVFIGGLIFYKVKNDFAPICFNVLYWLCLIGLPFYFIHLTLGAGVFDSIAIPTAPKSIIFYTIRLLHPNESMLRNSGMFWEPGGYQGYINLCLFMNFNRLQFILKKQRFRLIIIVFTLLTTQSTTGFLMLGLLIGMYILAYTNVNKVLAVTATIFFVAFAIFLFNTLDFLGAKLQQQYDMGMELNGDFNRSRFASVMFDLHYIQKNPLTGNGFDPKTRFADNPEVIAMIAAGDNLGLGNGFSNFIASAGILGMFWYLYLVYRNIKTVSLKDAIFWVIVIIVLLQGEDLLRFPFFFGLPFFLPIFSISNARKVSRNNHMLQ